MCGRFALFATGEIIAEQFQLDEAPQLAPRYNIAPTQPVVAVRRHPGTGRRELTHFHWGLIPSWSKDMSIGSRLINARSETAAEKPSFRAAFKYRRCLVPASGFYEWQAQNGRKQPHFIRSAGERPLAIAGLWEHWQGSDGSEIESCTLLTTTPNPFMAPLHNRMPVILHPDDYAVWLGEEEPLRPDHLLHLLRPYDGELVAYPVSTTVNSPHNEGPDCVAPL